MNDTFDDETFEVRRYEVVIIVDGERHSVITSNSLDTAEYYCNMTHNMIDIDRNSKNARLHYYHSLALYDYDTDSNIEYEEFD